MPHLYFAYGSNLDLEHMRERCPWSEPICAARLRRHCLAFAGHSALWEGGVATLVADPVGTLDGLLYALTDRAHHIVLVESFDGAPPMEFPNRTGRARPSSSSSPRRSVA